MGRLDTAGGLPDSGVRMTIVGAMTGIGWLGVDDGIDPSSRILTPLRTAAFNSAFSLVAAPVRRRASSPAREGPRAPRPREILTFIARRIKALAFDLHVALLPRLK